VRWSVAHPFGRIGQLTESGIALGIGFAGALQELPDRPPLVGRGDGAGNGFAVDGVTGAVAVPLVRTGRRGLFLRPFAEVIAADHVFDLPNAAHQLQFLAELTLVEEGQASNG
jgi:hypothetical protein